MGTAKLKCKRPRIKRTFVKVVTAKTGKLMYFDYYNKNVIYPYMQHVYNEVVHEWICKSCENELIEDI